MSNYPQTYRNKENDIESSNHLTSRPAQVQSTSRLPVKVLPTYIFPLKSSKPVKKSPKLADSSFKITRNKSSNSEKSLKSLKLSKSGSNSVLRPSNNISIHSTSVSKSKTKKSSKKSQNPLKSINLSLLIQAITEHCASCHKFQAELLKKDIKLA